MGGSLDEGFNRHPTAERESVTHMTHRRRLHVNPAGCAQFDHVGVQSRSSVGHVVDADVALAALDGAAIYNHNDRPLDQAALFWRLDVLLDLLRDAESPPGNERTRFWAVHRVSLMLSPSLYGSRTWRIGALSEVWGERVSNGEQITVLESGFASEIGMGSISAGYQPFWTSRPVGMQQTFQDFRR